MNILSLFDGMSCGRLALDRLGIKIDKYYASEIDKYAIEVSSANYPDTIQIGDVCDVKGEDYPDIDLILAGSPCQGFSFAGHQLAFDDPRSALFFEFVRVLKEVNPKYFLLENVKMKKEFLDIISDQVGVEPILINSSLLSAQNRQRYYWTNIPGVEQPEDRGLVLKDILETEADERPTKDTERNRRHHKTPEQKSLTMTATMYKGAGNNGMTLVPMDKPKRVGKIKKGGQGDRVYSDEGKSITLSAESGGTAGKGNMLIRVGTAVDIKGHDSIKRVYSPEGKSPTLTTMQGGHRQPKVLIDKKKIIKQLKKVNPRVEGVSINKDGIRPHRGDKRKSGLSEMGRILFEDAEKTPTITVNHSPKVIKGGAFRGRAYDKDGKRMDRDGSSVANKTKQMLELRQDDKSNALTTVQKDSLVVSKKSVAKYVPDPEAEFCDPYNKRTIKGDKSTTLRTNSSNGNMWVNESKIRDKSKTVRSGGRGSYDRHEWDSVDEMHWRKLTPLECERLQTVPDNYTNHVSNTQRYKMLGNGWTIEVIAHILRNME
jgi:DNA-cytosine methyltransferase